MAADGTLLQGEVNENPAPARDEKDAEKLLDGLLNALIAEQAGAN
jgi:hypothetical protein